MSNLTNYLTGARQVGDRFEGETMTYGANFISDGLAFDFTLPFEPDSIEVFNYTDSGVDGGAGYSFWFKNQAAASAIQVYHIENDGGSDRSSMDIITTNGFTDVSTDGGPQSYRNTISAITQANPGVITTNSNHDLENGDLIRITELGDQDAIDYGMGQLDGNKYVVQVVDDDEIQLRDQLTGDLIDTTNFDAYNSGGRINLVSRIGSRGFIWEKPQYKVTFGTGVVGSDGDVVFFRALKYGAYQSIGDLALLR